MRNVLGRLTLTVPFHLWESRTGVHQSVYKENSANFVLTGFSEVVAPASELCYLVQTLRRGACKGRRAQGMRGVVLVLATMALAILLASGVAQAIINGEPDRGPKAHSYVGALSISKI